MDFFETSIPNKLDTIFSVSEFLDYINTLLEIKNYTIQGEITSISIREKAVYFTLSDKKEEAKLECLMWKYKYNSLPVELEEGKEVKVYGSANIYKPFGKFTFIAEQISPVGEGELRNALERLKKRLQEQGYFDLENKKPIPKYPKTIGLITSNYGDAKKDFLTHLGNYAFQIMFYDARVEGVQAIETICEAIKWFNENTINTEVLVITRGGGSLESLQAFNSIEVAKAIFGSKIPIICAVGHENDITIADLVSDLRASTPTDAGKILSEPWKQSREDLKYFEKNIYSSFKKKYIQTKDILNNYNESYLREYQKYLNGLMTLIYDIDCSINRKFKSFRKNIDYLEEILFRSFTVFQNQLDKNNEKIAITLEDLILKSSIWNKHLLKRLDYNQDNLNISNPYSRLRQGYSITRNNKAIILKSLKLIKFGDNITTQFADGNIKSKVT